MKPGAHRILVVDDDLDEQFIAQRALKKVLGEKSVLKLVGSGDEAIAYFIGEGKFSDRAAYPFPTLVLLDLNMDQGDGFDVLEFLQNNPAWSVVPRIIFTTSDDDDDVRTAYALGASVYHRKPTNPADLEKLMREILGYWAMSEVPPVDEKGRLLITKSVGRRGARYPQGKGGEAMRRPAGRPLGSARR
jgi:CheY-like chemotaxis protein